MFKTALIAAALVSGGAFLGGAARTVYGPPSIAIPVHGAIKTTPDPGSTWSWHEEVTVDIGETVSVPVLVDFDGNGTMDTEYADLRVLITDLQATSSGEIDMGNGARFPTVVVRDAGGIRWDITPLPHGGADAQDTSGLLVNTSHLSTPSMLPVGSDLHVDITVSPKDRTNRTIRLNLLGRVVNL